MFELNLKLFTQKSSKKIIIVLRDFEAENEDLSSIKQTILSDINKIWTEISKPPEFTQHSPDSFFSFDFYPMSNKIFKPDAFLTDANRLRSMFELDSDTRIFSNNVTSVPADGLAIYCEQVWNAICNEKDLDIVFT